MASRLQIANAAQVVAWINKDRDLQQRTRTFQNMKTEATKAATRTGLLRTKPEKPPSRRR